MIGQHLKAGVLWNLTKIKCGITISKLLKLKLGDTFRFVIYHNSRHLVQAQRVFEASKMLNTKRMTIRTIESKLQKKTS